MNKRLKKRLKNIFNEKCDLIVISDACGYFIFNSFTDIFNFFDSSCINLLRYLVYDSILSFCYSGNCNISLKKKIYSDVRRMSKNELFFIFLYHNSDYFNDVLLIRYFCENFYDFNFIK